MIHAVDVVTLSWRGVGDVQLHCLTTEAELVFDTLAHIPTSRQVGVEHGSNSHY